MFLFVALMMSLNLAQLDKDVRRCKKANYDAPGCSLYVKLNMHKENNK